MAWVDLQKEARGWKPARPLNPEPVEDTLGMMLAAPLDRIATEAQLDGYEVMSLRLSKEAALAADPALARAVRLAKGKLG